MSNLITRLYRAALREQAIRYAQRWLSEKTGRPITRDEVLAAHERWKARHPDWKETK